LRFLCLDVLVTARYWLGVFEEKLLGLNVLNVNGRWCLFGDNHVDLKADGACTLVRAVSAR